MDLRGSGDIEAETAAVDKGLQREPPREFSKATSSLWVPLSALKLGKLILVSEFEVPQKTLPTF